MQYRFYFVVVVVVVSEMVREIEESSAKVMCDLKGGVCSDDVIRIASSAQWLEQIWDHGNSFETWVVRATEG